MTRVRDVRAFLADRGTRRVRDHAWTSRVLSWPVCAHCGLVALKNDATRKAMASPCVTYE